MKKKIINYVEFITESKLMLLLEANIEYTNVFKEILNEIDSPISKKLLNLSGQEVDINRNYMTIDIDKEDSVVFLPDDKFKKLPIIVEDPGHSYSGLANYAQENGIYPIKNIRVPNSGQIVEIVKELDKEILDKLYRGSTPVPITHIRWKDSQGEGEMFYTTQELVRDTSSIKSSDVKVGRFVTNLLTKAGIEFKPKEIEEFVDKYKSALKLKKESFNRFEIVKGEDIRKWYFKDNYKSEDGTLGSSCMRYSKCQKFLDIYVENDSVSLIILKSKTDNEKIIGRALLWDATLVNDTEDTEDSDIKFMDRIYINDSADTEFFIQFAINNGFYYKKKQDYSTTPLVFNKKILSDDESLIKVSITSGDYNYYPYMDTVKFYNSEDGILTNDDSDGHEYELTDTDGGNGSCSECGGCGNVECINCDGDGEVGCNDCNGNGNVECSDCDGYGEIDCNNCDGDGETQCSECDGAGNVECEECDGSGKDSEGDDCEYCDDGRLECSDCEGEGREDCSDCDGSGKNSCRECGGDGQVECQECYGRGEGECHRCDGSGRVDCYECR
jgi:hypothetical protein